MEWLLPLSPSLSCLLLLLQCRVTDWLSLQLHFSKFKIGEPVRLQDGQSNCITVHTCRPRSAPYICATPHKEGEAYSHPAQSLWRLCRLVGKHNPIFKNHWGHCTLKSCCHSWWNHFELHHAVMSQSLQTNMEELFLCFIGFHLSCYSNVHKQRLDLVFFLCVFTMCSLLTYNNNTASSVLHSWCIHKNACPQIKSQSYGLYEMPSCSCF